MFKAPERTSKNNLVQKSPSCSNMQSMWESHLTCSTSVNITSPVRRIGSLSIYKKVPGVAGDAWGAPWGMVSEMVSPGQTFECPLGRLWEALGGFWVVFVRFLTLFGAPWERKTWEIFVFGVLRFPYVKLCISWVWAAKWRPKWHQGGPKRHQGGPT